MLRRFAHVRDEDPLLEIQQRVRRRLGSGIAAERAVACCVDDASAGLLETRAQHIEMSLLQASTGLVAEPREVLRRPDHIGERERHHPFEAPLHHLAETVLQLDHLGQRQAFVVGIHGGRY